MSKKNSIPNYEQTPTEAEEQAVVIEFCDLMRLPAIHIANEGRRTLANGRQLVRMGLRRGVPDLFFPAALQGYHGLFIELKRTKSGRLTDDQRKWLDYLNRKGYRAVVCYGADEAIKEIKSYFGRA